MRCPNTYPLVPCLYKNYNNKQDPSNEQAILKQVWKENHRGEIQACTANCFHIVGERKRKQEKKVELFTVLVKGVLKLILR